VQLYNDLTWSNSSTARKILQADLQLRSRYDDCWSSHILSAMNGLAQSCSKKGCWSVSLVILVVLLWTSGRGTWIIGDLILICIHESGTAIAPLIINGAPSLPRGPWSHIRHTPFLETCSLTFLVTWFAAWHISYFVPTPYELEQWPGLTVPPLLVTCAMLMTYKMSNTLFFTTPIHVQSLSAGFMRLCFIPQVFDNMSAFLKWKNVRWNHRHIETSVI